MAGKTRRRAPASCLPQGHMELKSSALCTTDAKLVSQYLVVEHMAAHYKKLNEAKSRIDSTIPKAWAVSTKGALLLFTVRDRFRREALREDIGHHQAWLSSRTARPSSRASCSGSQGRRSPRIEYTAKLDKGDFDNIDDAMFRGQSSVGREGGATGQVHLSEDDLRLVNQIIQDSRTSPSKYHHKQMPSNIPPSFKGTKTGLSSNHVTLRHPKSQLLQSYTVAPHYLSSATLGRHQGDVTNRHITPRSGDLLEKQAHKFTDEKPFMPRTLKTNCTSKLTEFKYYNPPPKKHVAKSSKDTTRGGTGMLRSETPMTDSVDLMHETLMSRDAARVPPSDIPPLDISLDADHLSWLKEQSKMAQLRKSHKYTTLRTTSSLSHHLLAGKSQNLNNDTKPLLKTGQSTDREDELRYLEFISDVTNDVLDRGIFTNRVLKQIFESHIEKHRGDLKESKMRQMLADLWKDLGISPDEDPIDMSSITKHSHFMTAVNSTSKKHPMSDVTSEPSEPVPPPRPAHRQHCSSPSSTGSPQMTTLRAAPRNKQAKPPLPVGGSIRSQCDHNVFEDVSREEEEDEEERKTQMETADMMAAILNNGHNGKLQPGDSLSAFDMVDLDETLAQEQDTVPDYAADIDERAVTHDAVIADEQPSVSKTNDTTEQDPPLSPVVNEVEEDVMVHFPTERAASPKNEITTNGVNGLRGTDNDHHCNVDTDHPTDWLIIDKEKLDNADDIKEENGTVNERYIENTEKNSPVFNNNENEKDTARSGGYTDDGWESNGDANESEEEDTLRESGNKMEKEKTETKSEEELLPRAMPRQRKPEATARSDVKDAPMSLEQTMSSESLDVSDLDDDDEDF